TNHRRVGVVQMSGAHLALLSMSGVDNQAIPESERVARCQLKRPIACRVMQTTTQGDEHGVPTVRPTAWLYIATLRCTERGDVPAIATYCIAWAGARRASHTSHHFHTS